MKNYELNPKGIMNVENELRRLGAVSVTQTPVGRKIHLCATNASGQKVTLWVKTKQKGNWHHRLDDVKPTDDHFWVFVDFGDATNPKYWIVPDRRIRNDIYSTHQEYLKNHGGRRPKNNDSKHHAIYESQLKKEWENNWEILKIF